LTKINVMRSLPDEFVAYHARGASMEGPVSSTALGWFQLWPLAEVQSLNKQYEVAAYAPELVAFGSDGGGEMLAFDAKNQIVKVPFVGMAMDYAKIVATTWPEFERILAL